MRLIVLVMAILSAAPLFANDFDVLVSFGKTDVISGEPLEFDLYFHNSGAAPGTIVLPEYVQCVFSNGQRSAGVKALLVQPLPPKQYSLAAGGFLEGRYRLEAPDQLEGVVKFYIVDYETAPVLLSMSATPPPGVSEATAAQQENDTAPTIDELFSMYQPYLANISAYEPMYFLLGVDPEYTKFQLSLKYLFFDARSVLGQTYPWLQGLHFGYTQTSFWDLASDSAPFEDTSYKPELFHVTPNLSFKPRWMKGLFLQTGARHESNGRGGIVSRSTNTLYLRPMMVFYNPQNRLGLLMAPKFMAYVNNDDDTNHDLPDYRGYVDLQIKAGKADGLVVGSSIRLARRGTSFELDMTYPLQRLWSKSAGIYLQAQYVDLLAESLLNYRDRRRALRLGVAIVR